MSLEELLEEFDFLVIFKRIIGLISEEIVEDILKKLLKEIRARIFRAILG